MPSFNECWMFVMAVAGHYYFLVTGIVSFLIGLVEGFWQPTWIRSRRFFYVLTVVSAFLAVALAWTEEHRYRLAVADELSDLRSQGNSLFIEWWSKCDDVEVLKRLPGATGEWVGRVHDTLRTKVSRTEADYFSIPGSNEPIPDFSVLAHCAANRSPNSPLEVATFGHRIDRLAKIIERIQARGRLQP